MVREGKKMFENHKSKIQKCRIKNYRKNIPKKIFRCIKNFSLTTIHWSFYAVHFSRIWTASYLHQHSVFLPLSQMFYPSFFSRLQSKWCRLRTWWACSPRALTRPQRCAASNRWRCWFRGIGLSRGETKTPECRLTEGWAKVKKKKKKQ